MKLLLQIMVVVLTSYHLLSQDLTEDLQLGESPGFISFGLDKLENTFQFKADADFTMKLLEGELRFMNNYRGAAIQRSFRDDENLKIRYDLPLSESFAAVFSQNSVYYSDSRLGDISKLTRINGLGGLKFNFRNSSYIELKGGGENYTSSALNTLGTVLNFAAVASPVELLGASLAGSGSGQTLNLGKGRSINKLKLAFNISKEYNVLDKIALDLRYRLFDRDFYSQSGFPELGYILQNRYEDALEGSASMSFAFTNEFFSSFNIDFFNGYVDRSYNSNYLQISDSRIIKYFNDLRLGFNYKMQYELKKFKQNLGVVYNMADKDHNISRKGNINEIEYNQKLNEEKRLDFNSSFSGIIGLTEFSISNINLFRLNYSLNLYKYDSPSDFVNDDRDELTAAFGLSYTRIFSRLLSAGIILDVNLDHLVYIKKEMSASNNWKRILRFAPFISINSGGFRMKPQIEVLANYTVYDFERVIPNISSQSFRQISFRDSLIYRFSKNVSSSSRLFYRYYEEGMLYWNSFSESPRNSNSEALATLILNYETKNFIAGIGGRVYKKNVRSLNKKESAPFAQYDVLSLSPEALIKFSVFIRTTVSLNGWYEFRWRNKELQLTPNLFINTSLSI